MNSCFSSRRHRWSTLAGALLCLGSVLSASAQTDRGGQDPVVLGSKRATQLVIHQVKPEYPALAKVNYIQGPVLVQLTVSRDGRVARAHILRGHPILAASALRAVRRWLYRPLTTAVGPAAFLTIVRMNFYLRLPTTDHLPPQAEADLSRQVKPPQVLTKPPGQPSAPSVRLRVLLSDAGEIMDSGPVKGPSSAFEEEARRAVEQWTFQPARWGTLSVPWYLEVDVPVANRGALPPGAGPGGR
jgi:TonB family protein